MRPRGIVLSTTCLAFLAVTSLGLHFHVDELDHPESNSQEAYAISELDAAHAQEHLSHGDVDVEAKVVPVTKSGLPVSFAVLSLFCALLFLTPLRRGRIALPAERPLRPPREAYFLPPSQAPPHSA